MTYDELRTSIENWSENHDPEFLAQVDTFIRLAENRIVTAVRLPQFSKTASVAILSGSQSSTFPTDFLSVDSITVGTGRPLLMKEPEFIYEAYQGGTGTPRFFGLQTNNSVVWGPTPDANYTATLRYFNYPASICDTHGATGTYLSTTFPAALMSGSLWMASNYMKDWTGAQLHQENFKDALGLSAAFTFGPYSKQGFERKSASVDGNADLGRP